MLGARRLDEQKLAVLFGQIEEPCGRGMVDAHGVDRARPHLREIPRDHGRLRPRLAGSIRRKRPVRDSADPQTRTALPEKLPIQADPATAGATGSVSNQRRRLHRAEPDHGRTVERSNVFSLGGSHRVMEGGGKLMMNVRISRKSPKVKSGKMEGLLDVVFGLNDLSQQFVRELSEWNRRIVRQW